MRPLTALCALALAANFACIARSALHQAPPAAREHRDVAYYSGEDFDDAKHRLNVFVPKGDGPHPIIVFAHGGGWFFGDRKELTDVYSKLGRRFAARGILTLVISYRLAPKHQHPAQIKDVARAVAWAFGHAHRYRGDQKRIFLMGHSAGAQLMALAACDPSWLGAHGLSPRELAGVIPISGPYDVRGLGRSHVTGATLVAPAFGKNSSAWREASPVSHLRAAVPPPFLVAWADGDFEVLRRHARAFVAALRSRGAKVQTAEAPFKGHFTVAMDLGEPGDPLGDEIERFVHHGRPSLQTTPQ